MKNQSNSSNIDFNKVNKITVKKVKEEKINKKKAALCFLLIAGFIAAGFQKPSNAAEFNSAVTTQNIGFAGTTLPSNVQYYPPGTTAGAAALNNLNNNVGNTNTTNYSNRTNASNLNANASVSSVNNIGNVDNAMPGSAIGATNANIPPEAAAKFNQGLQEMKRQQNQTGRKPVVPAGAQDIGYNKMLAEQNKVRVLPSTGIEAHNKSSLSYYTEQGRIEDEKKIIEAYRKMYSEKK